jgi:hypothetical protein
MDLPGSRFLEFLPDLYQVSLGRPDSALPPALLALAYANYSKRVKTKDLMPLAMEYCNQAFHRLQIKVQQRLESDAEDTLIAIQLLGFYEVCFFVSCDFTHKIDYGQSLNISGWLVLGSCSRSNNRHEAAYASGCQSVNTWNTHGRYIEANGTVYNLKRHTLTNSAYHLLISCRRSNITGIDYLFHCGRNEPSGHCPLGAHV